MESKVTMSPATAAPVETLPDVLQPRRAGNFTIGYVPEMHGPEAEGCPAFLPSRFELIQLARYWVRSRLDTELDWFFTQQTGSDDIRLRPYASMRLARIAEVIGEDDVRRVEDEEASKVRETLGP